ncbi:MAG: winged helix-turn-helix domain-containing protein, partial [Eubacteriales bacterium]
MAIPDYQTIMLPLLKIAGYGKEHSLSEVIENLAQTFALSSEERKELLSSGRQAKFDNRVGWARTYMKKAGLLESTGRGKLRITDRGMEVLKSNPTNINANFLKQYPEFLEFQNISKQDNKQSEKDEETDQTPEEILEQSYLALRTELAQELLERIKKCSPKFFETLVVDLLVAMGYGGSR